jgi:transposase-like protein
VLSTKAGDLEVGIPKFRRGSFFPEIPEPGRRIDQALYAVVMEAYVNGASTRAVGDLMAAMGINTGTTSSSRSVRQGSVRLLRRDGRKTPVTLGPIWLGYREAALT